MDRMAAMDVTAVAQARAGDDAAFRALVERYSPQIFRLAYRVTGNEEDAEDVVQETFLKAYRSLKGFEARANFGTWIYRIGVNCALDFARLRRRRDERQREPDAERPGDMDALEGSSPAPDQLMLNTEARTVLERALGTLSPKERTAFVLRHYEGMSISEICKVMGVRTNAAKNNVFRAVKKRSALEPLVPGSTHAGD